MAWITETIAKIDRMMDAIKQAKELGTFNAADRSKQYTRVDNPELLRAVNEAWTKIRSNEKAIAAKDQEIGTLRETVKSVSDKLNRARTVNLVLTLVVIGLWEVVKAILFR